MTASVLPADASTRPVPPSPHTDVVVGPTAPALHANAELRVGARLPLAIGKYRDHIIACSILFAVGLGYRLRELHVPLYGDQALYYYLSKTLGFAPESVRELPSLWPHFVVRPFMYVFFWPWANLGMTTFRVANIVVGSLVPCLCYALSVRFRVRPGLAAIAALAVAVHPVVVAFSGRCFPDNLATALMLAGYLAYFGKRVRSATVVFLLTVLAKEAFAMFLLPLILDGAYRFVSSRSRLIAAPIVGLLAVATTNLLSVRVFGGELQGWSSSTPNEAFFRGFLISAWFIPLYALLLLEKQLSVLAISLAAPTFFVAWSSLLHRGVEQWYIYGPFCVAVVALSVGLQHALSIVVTAGPDPQRDFPSRVERWRRLASHCCALSLLATIIVVPEQAGWRNWLDLVKFDQLLDLQPKVGHDHVERMAKRVQQRQPENLLVMDSFWAFAYYPFGPSARRVHNHYTGPNTTAAAMAELQGLVRQHDYVVTGDSSNNSAQAALFQKAFAPCVVENAGKYTLYAVRGKCLDELSR